MPSDQSEGEYRILEELEAKLVEFVKNGGVLPMSTSWVGIDGKPPTSMSVDSIAIAIISDFQFDANLAPSTSFSPFTNFSKIQANVANQARFIVLGKHEVLATNKSGQPIMLRISHGEGEFILSGLTFESPNNSKEWHKFFSNYLDYLGTLIKWVRAAAAKALRGIGTPEALRAVNLIPPE